MAKSNAERQKAYRDRKRGGPSKGRLAGHRSLADEAKGVGMGRTRCFMIGWLKANALDATDDWVNGTVSLNALYKRVREELDIALFISLQNATEDQLSGNGWTQVWHREQGKFVVEWVLTK